VKSGVRPEQKAGFYYCGRRSLFVHNRESMKFYESKSHHLTDLFRLNTRGLTDPSCQIHVRPVMRSWKSAPRPIRPHTIVDKLQMGNWLTSVHGHAQAGRAKCEADQAE
jgi:hypothetical protein